MTSKTPPHKHASALPFLLAFSVILFLQASRFALASCLLRSSTFCVLCSRKFLKKISVSQLTQNALKRTKKLPLCNNRFAHNFFFLEKKTQSTQNALKRTEMQQNYMLSLWPVLHANFRVQGLSMQSFMPIDPHLWVLEGYQNVETHIVYTHICIYTYTLLLIVHLILFWPVKQRVFVT